MLAMTANEIRRAHSNRMTTAELVELIYNLPLRVMESRRVVDADRASRLLGNTDEALVKAFEAIRAACVDEMVESGLCGDRKAVEAGMIRRAADSGCGCGCESAV